MNDAVDIPAEILDRVVRGHRVEPQPLRGLLAGGPTLLVFLRHFG